MRKRKVIAGLLISCLVLQTPSTMIQANDVFANKKEAVGSLSRGKANEKKEQNARARIVAEGEVGDEAKKMQVSPELEDTNKQNENKEDKVESAAKSAVGAVEVKVQSALSTEVDANRTFTVMLKKEGSEDAEIIENTAFTDTEGVKAVSFPKLTPGSYTVSVKTDGFETFVQTVKVDNLKYQLNLLTGFVAGQSSQAHHGIMKIGDANRDGAIDKSDMETIIAATEKGSGEADLNGDGKTDEIDLQYFAQNFERAAGEDLSSTITTSIPKEVIVPTVEAGVQVSGDLNGVLEENGKTVTLQNASGTVSETTPIAVEFSMSGVQGGATVPVEGIVIESPVGDGMITKGQVIVTDENDQEIPIEIGAPASVFSGVRGATVTPDENGTLVIDLGKQVAIKKVTIKITGTTSNNLAEITTVEFLNDMENRIPKPDMNIPTELKVVELSEQLNLSWKPERNVTGYEVEISGSEGDAVHSEVIKTTKNSVEIRKFRKADLKNKQEYKLRVQSVNGNWRGGYSEPVIGIPKITDKPEAPDGVSVSGRYKSLQVSWAKMKDTESYRVFYKKKGADTYQNVSDIKETSYLITGLEDRETYYIYVTGVNEIGESPRSLESVGTTTDINPPQMPNRSLINTSNGQGVLSNNITNVTIGRGSMLESPLDQGNQKSGLGLVDNDFGSRLHVTDWDEGGSYPGNDKGITVEFNQEYKMNYITFAEDIDRSDWSGLNVVYWDNAGKQQSVNGRIMKRQSVNKKNYFGIKLDRPINAKKIKIGLGRSSSYSQVWVSEMRFYHYDSLEDEIMALYVDDTFTTLRDDVNEEAIAKLEVRVNEKDTATQEYHTDREFLQREIDTARGILNDTLRPAQPIKSTITGQKDGHLGFGGLNSWQPLGLTAQAGEKIIIYVGHNSQRTGSATKLRLVSSQYYSEYSSVAKEVATLKVGKNQITIPKLQSLAAEGGGSLYISYTGNDTNDKYAVRVSGGVEIPVLDLHQVSDEAERTARITKYVKELEKQVSTLEAKHDELHKDNENDAVNYDFNNKSCILGATDILLDHMMYSGPAEQILKGLGTGNFDSKVNKMSNSAKAMVDMMKLFYQHKGLSNAEGASNKDRLPSQHLNIRYQRMFAGAFMYAAGNHIGVEWDSITGLTSTSPPQIDANGKYISGDYFGWGIGHEIGHNINQGRYAVAEVTNNYFSLLSQAEDTNSSVRFSYKDVYDKVTSNTTGSAEDVFTQLGMYWQLHLAYDRGYNFKTYDTYKEQTDNLFFARVDRYARDASKAPKPSGTALKLDADSEQQLMRLATAAAEKNILEFFRRWGMVPDSETIAYAEQFPEEERAIYYVNDEARVYEIEKGTDTTIKGQDILKDTVTAVVDSKSQNQVNFTLETNAPDPSVILGYEIARYSTEGGQESRQVVGFTTEDKFTDTVTTINNRVFTYEVTAIDQFLNRSVSKKLSPVKISHDGSHAKKEWTVTTNMHSDDDAAAQGQGHEGAPCAPEAKSTITRVTDNDRSTTFKGKTETENPEILLSFNKSLEVTALKYTAETGTPIGAYEIQISDDKKTWTTVKTGVFDLKNGVQTLYFENTEVKDSKFIYTYDAKYVKLVALNQANTELSISEIDVLGPTGDNVEFKTDDASKPAFGILKNDYKYGKEEKDKIPAGSMVFIGTYKGHPAFNVVLLYDENGNNVGGVDETGALNASQIILADVPAQGELGETSDGTFIYWIEPDSSGAVPKFAGTVRGELYRVDNAMTNEGQRFVSDTLPAVVPETLPDIELTGRKMKKK